MLALAVNECPASPTADRKKLPGEVFNVAKRRPEGRLPRMAGRKKARAAEDPARLG